jgi:hypothetical protein
MDYNEQIRHQAELDSRRVSTGVLCEVVRNSGPLNGLLGLLRDSGSDYIPLTEGARSNDTGYDSQSRTVYAVPKPFLEYIEELLTEFRNDNKALPELLTEQEREDYRADKKMRMEELLRLVQDHVFLATVHGDVDGACIDGRYHDVYLHTREQASPLARPILKDESVEPDPEGEKSWVREVKDPNQRYRRALGELSDALKQEAERGRPSNRR